ncbi:tetratricopeptide repeat protein [Candidatus Electronema sp. TJ]|uniref:tetratricopeptide repeat protein n=1 Tax=Candidatus Electronema sp. TJ TaxID=3401573 RepID=UPI003AA96B8B
MKRAVKRKILAGCLLAALFCPAAGRANSSSDVTVTLPPTHPAAAAVLSERAGQLKAQGRLDEAEKLYLQALAIWETSLGKEHPAAAKGLSNLAELRKAQGRLDEAEALHRRALALWENALGSGHPSVGFSLRSLALLHEAQGRLDEADTVCRRAETILKNSLPVMPDELLTDCRRIRQRLVK